MIHLNNVIMRKIKRNVREPFSFFPTSAVFNMPSGKLTLQLWSEVYIHPGHGCRGQIGISMNFSMPL